MPITEPRTCGTPRASRRHLSVACALALLLGASGRAQAQVRERPVPFDSAGRIMAITPPLASRLGLAQPLWPATGDYLEARLYALDDAEGSAVLVVRRPREVLERFPFSAAQRRELTSAVDRGVTGAPRGTGTEDMATTVSEPVRGGYVLNQTLLGGLVFGPAAAALTDDPAAGTAAYLIVTGGTFFMAAQRSKHGSVSRAQNHLAWHGARQGAGAAYLATYAIAGDDIDEKAFAAATLVGGVLGDIIGDRLGRPMTDAEAHGVSHGGVVLPVLVSGALGTVGLSRDEGPRRGLAAVALGAQALGYPLGMRYVRGPRYRVTAGDVGSLVVGEAIGVAAAVSIIGDNDGVSDEIAAGAITAGFALGAIVADRAFVNPFDYTDSESRLLQLGTLAGGVVALAVPVAAQANDARPYFAAATVGGLLGAVLTHRLLEPARASANGSLTRRTGLRARSQRFDVSFTPQTLIMASTGARGQYPVLHVDF
jgi:hypothetical protein